MDNNSKIQKRINEFFTLTYSHNETENSNNTQSELSNSNITEKKGKKRKIIHKNFLLLKKSLHLDNFMRKTQIDSLLKKCKSKLFKSIHDSINLCLKKKLPRLPQSFITNIKIDFNKFYLCQSIISIYIKNQIFESFDELIQKDYIIKEKEESLKIFFNITLQEVFEYYLNSKKYLDDYLRILKREGENFATLFDFISHIFLNYYLKGKGNKPKIKNNKIKTFKSLSISKRKKLPFSNRKIHRFKNQIFQIEKT
jgi:hypothetical protein